MSDSRLQARFGVFYALRVYLPFSHVAQGVRAQSRALRGKVNRHQQATKLPDAPWHQLFPSKSALLVESAKANGNVRVSELAVLAKAAAAVPPGREIIEIGTFDGRTTLNLAVNSAPTTPVFTLDLPPELATKFALDRGERKFVDKPAPGERYRRASAPWKDSTAKITQLLGDSGTFDWSAHFGKAGLVFVDGSHAYDYAKHDTEMAFKLVAPGGMVLWHDYGVWEGVTRALEELETERKLGLKQVRGTSLVFWRNQQNA